MKPKVDGSTITFKSKSGVIVTLQGGGLTVNQTGAGSGWWNDPELFFDTESTKNSTKGLQILGAESRGNKVQLDLKYDCGDLYLSTNGIKALLSSVQFDEHPYNGGHGADSVSIEVPAGSTLNVAKEGTTYNVSLLS